MRVHPPYKLRGEERREKDYSSACKVSWWIGKAADWWMKRFGKIEVWFEKLESLYLGLLILAYVFIAFRKALVI
jgi:hypothetical protein